MSGSPGGEMEWEFAEDADGGGSFVATGKVVNFLRTHLARGEMDEALALYESCAQDVMAGRPRSVTPVGSRAWAPWINAPVRWYGRCLALSKWLPAAASSGAA